MTFKRSMFAMIQLIPFSFTNKKTGRWKPARSYSNP